MIIGIDIGTQSAKAVVADETLNVLGSASHAYAVSYPKPGWAEQDPHLWEAALGPVIEAALKDADVSKDSITALGLAGQLDGAVATDAKGEPLHPCLIWVDKRAADIMADIPTDKIRAINGIVADPSHMAAKIVWLKQALGEAAANAHYHQPTSWLVARLTGERVLDHGHASTTMLYDLKSKTWSEELLAAFGISAAELPRIDDSFASAGKLSPEGAAITGLPVGISVAVGTGDDFSNPLGAGLARPGQLACCLGTAEVVGALDNAPKIDHSGLLQTLGYPTGHYFIENPGWLSGGSVEWAVSILGFDNPAHLDLAAQSVPLGSDGVLFLPTLGGATAPEWIASARGCFYGLTPAHDRHHMARAVLEGCAFAMRDVADRLHEMQVPLESLLLLGGGARSDLWAQIRADLSGLPVIVPDVADTSPVGAAVLAAVAGGYHGDVTSATAAIGGTRKTFAPNPALKAAYDNAHGAYRRLFHALKPIFEG